MKNDVHGLSLNAQSVQLTEHLQKSVFRKSNHKNYIFLDIDISMIMCNTYASSYWQRRLYLLCRGAILRSSKWCKTFYNDAINRWKWTTTLLGRLRTFGQSDLSKSKLNSYAIYNTTNTFLCTPKTRTREGPFNIYQIIGQVHWHTGHILYFLVYPRMASRFSKIYFLNSSWTGRIHFFTQTIRFFFCSTVYSINSIVGQIDILKKGKNAPAHQSDKYWTVPEKKCTKNATDLFQSTDMIGD